MTLKNDIAHYRLSQQVAKMAEYRKSYINDMEEKAKLAIALGGVYLIFSPYFMRYEILTKSQKKELDLEVKTKAKQLGLNVKRRFLIRDFYYLRLK